MRFFLGSHMPNWLGHTTVPLFVSYRRLIQRNPVVLPRATGPWALDSGGFTELSSFGEWRTTPAAYLQAVARYEAEIGLMAFAAPQDWMCEPWIVAKTGLSVREHQRRTVENFYALRAAAPELPIVPVLQGWTVEDYERCVAMYEHDLATEPIVGLGSVCRRQDTAAAEAIVVALMAHGLRLHGFGMKTEGFRRYGYLLASADSMAWSYAGRKRPDPTCPLGSCSNCLHYALAWREDVMAAIDGPMQTHLGAR